MITQPPRAGPSASSPTSPASRNAASPQQRSPITPGRYRAHASVHQAFPSPSSPRSRRSSIVETVDGASSSNSPSSNWQASIELSLTTRRRLIRKPLPQIPSSHNADSIHPSDTASGLISPATLDAQCQRADSWWPDSLPQKHSAPLSSTSQAANTSANPHTPALDPQQPDNPGLDDQSLQHLLSILHYAALQSEGASASTQEDGTIGRNNVVVSATGTYKRQSPLNGTSASASKGADYHDQYVLDQATLDSLYRALQAAFRHLSQKQVLGALQRTASIRWRAEAQLRNATAAQAAETTASSSRWTRFAWPAAALGKAYKEAQRSILPPLPGQSAFVGFESASQIHMAQDAYTGLYLDPDHRVRKRDVAVRILSNAIWFVRNYGPAAGVETLDASAPATTALDQASSPSDPASQGAAGELMPPSLSSIRRTSENLLKKNAGLPTFLSKSSATTALSGTATPESARSDAAANPEATATSPSTAATPESLSIASSVSSPQVPVVPPSESAPDTASTALPPPETGATSTPDPSTKNNNAGGEKSKAVEHLASLSAAVGAAMRQRAQQATAAAVAHGGAPEDWIDAPPTTTGARRPSLHTFVSRSEAEAAETDALEKAEKDYLAEIGQGCNEWAKMVVCRLCASISVKGDDASGTIRHRRSGTVTARDAAKARTEGADTSVGSSLSTRSDMTAKAAKVSSRSSDDLSPADDTHEAVAWKPDVYEGAELLSHLGEHRPGVSLQDEDQRVRLVGGSFVCRVESEEQRQALFELLELGLYVGMSMLLESSFLTDSDAARPKPVKIPTRTTSAVEPPSRGASLAPPFVRTRSSSQATIDGSQRSVSGSSSTREPHQSDLNADADGQSHGVDLAPSKPAPRKWTKSLWGMLGQHPHDAADAEGEASIARSGMGDGHEAHSHRSALTMHRYHTEDDANTLSSTRKALFKTGEEPKQSIAARKAALFASVSNNSAPPTPQGLRGSASNANGSANKPHRLVGRLINAFARPNADAPQKDAQHPTSAASSLARSRDTDIHPPTSAQSVVATHLSSSRSQAQLIRTRPETIFPVTSPSPAALSTSPELSLLQCYQYQQGPQHRLFPSTAYLTAFYRLQALRFLADQPGEHVTFASPSHGISASGDLLPFVGVQKQASSAWSVISSRSQQPQPTQLAATPIQLLSYELLSGDGSAVGLCREEVAFYQRLSNNRDVPLGQVVEELSIRACALEADRDTMLKVHDSRIASSKQNASSAKDRTGQPVAQRQGINSVYGMPEQRLHFVHGQCRIRIVATVMPPSVCGDESEAPHDTVFEDKVKPKEKGPEVDVASRSPSLQASASRDSDVSAIAAASHTDKEAAKTAFAVAETAVRAAETGASQLLIDQKGSGSTSGIWMWNASAKSGWQGQAVPMSESTYLLSFARYLEAVSYHPALRRAAGLEPVNTKAYGGLSNVQQQLRQGRSEDARSIAEGPNLLRFFRSGRSLVKVQVQPLVVYDLHIEGPCLKTSSDRRRERKQKQAQAEKRRFKQLAEETRLEIQRFFASIKRNTTRLEDVFVSRELDEAGRTIRSKTGAPIPSADAKPAPAVGAAASSSDSTISDQLAQPLTFLTNLRASLRADEFELYEALQRTLFLDGINDIRKAFADRAKSAKNRLAAWTKKHLSKKEQADFGSCVYDEPEYIKAGLRAFPGSCYIIRDDEPLSIIAFSLSSRDFRAEMGTLGDRKHDADGYMGSSNDEHVKQWRSGVVDGGQSAAGAGGSIISTAGSTDTSTTASSAMSLLKDRSMRKVPLSQLDPDTDEVFFDAEPVRAALKRKKRARESSILSMTLRRVGSTISDSRGASYQTLTANSLPASSASSLKGRNDDDDDDDEDDDDEDDGEGRGKNLKITGDGRSRLSSVASGSRLEVGSPARDLDATPSRRTSAARFDNRSPSPSPNRPELRNSGSVSALRRTFELRSQASFSSIPDRKSSIQAGTASTISTTSKETTFQAQVTPISGRPASLATIFSSGQPGLETPNSRTSNFTGASAPRAIPRTAPASRRPSGAAGAADPSAAEIGLSVDDLPSLSDDGSSSSSRSPRKHGAQPSNKSEGVAGADAHSMVSNSTLPGSQAAESPHIKHNLVHGTTKISCVSWFAEEFAALRERWGVEHEFAHSLARCSPWAATGGKSKSAFFKTADERFIAKQLLTVWSVDEKEAFLEFAPAYIRYMMNSAVNACPTLLVKIAGVYSIKIKDTKSGETKLKMNVMLLENLWAGDGGKSIRFDLKGIRDRKVKLSAQQQQDLEQAATQAAAEGQPLVNVPGVTQGAATAAWSAGVQAAASSTVKANSGDSQKAGTSEPAGSKGATSPGSADESSKSAVNGAAAAAESEARPASGSSAVWWDSEWISRYRHRAFVPETQKELFYRALQNDTRFLTASNVMDYSLLLGVMERPIRADDMYPAPARAAGGVANVHEAEGDADEVEDAAERPSFRCRIVDFLGAFTLAKQLESSSKKALKAQDAKANVTILPPSEYASRFLSAMDSYFIGTPSHPRLDARYGFDRMCDDTARAAGSEGSGASAVRQPRLASVL
ncbi:hypothetical protein PaG_06319 [Moesziomyces aphidis]|uniref:PIPK domain-containing protein n=1 Tax=Moesziomyces aphidis TaxID=84754 RepID=W3VG76_MOEAP|nr:hypothetical protein PaG_06319 [Moesziomyces aphidis]